MRRRCVVTGATGLVGSHLLPVLAQRYEVHATTRRNIAGAAHPGVHWHAMQLEEVPDVSSLPERADCVVYLAQSEHFRDFPARANEVFAVNVAAVLHFLDYARRAGATNFVLASSGGVYEPSEAPLTENLAITTRRDLGFYLGTKLSAELLAEQFAAFFSVAVLRYFFVYGPGQADHMLVPRLVRAVQSGIPIKLSGRDGIRLNPTYVSDAVEATLSAVDLTASHRINVAGPEVVTMRQLGMLIGEQVNRDPVFDEDPSAAPRDLVGDTTKLRALLAEPRVGVRDGIARLLAAETLATSSAREVG